MIQKTNSKYGCPVRFSLLASTNGTVSLRGAATLLKCNSMKLLYCLILVFFVSGCNNDIHVNPSDFKSKDTISDNWTIHAGEISTSRKFVKDSVTGGYFVPDSNNSTKIVMGVAPVGSTKRNKGFNLSSDAGKMFGGDDVLEIPAVMTPERFGAKPLYVNDIDKYADSVAADFTSLKPYYRFMYHDTINNLLITVAETDTTGNLIVRDSFKTIQTMFDIIKQQTKKP